MVKIYIVSTLGICFFLLNCSIVRIISDKKKCFPLKRCHFPLGKTNVYPNQHHIGITHSGHGHPVATMKTSFPGIHEDGGREGEREGKRKGKKKSISFLCKVQFTSETMRTKVGFYRRCKRGVCTVILHRNKWKDYSQSFPMLYLESWRPALDYALCFKVHHQP